MNVILQISAFTLLIFLSIPVYAQSFKIVKGGGTSKTALTAGQTLAVSIFSSAYSFEAVLSTSGAVVVELRKNGSRIYGKTESVAPYALCGDSSGNFYDCRTKFSHQFAGEYELIAYPSAEGSNSTNKKSLKFIVQGEQPVPPPVAEEPTPTPSPVPQPTTDDLTNQTRIAFSSDGNAHDCDDVLATAVTVGMLARSGIAKNLVYYGYNDHIWGNEKSTTSPCGTGQTRADKMKASAVSTATIFGGVNVGFKMTDSDNLGYTHGVFISAIDNPVLAVNRLAAEISKSTSSSPLIIIGAGPMEIIGRALKKVNDSTSKNSLQYVTFISHSKWNDEHALQHINHKDYADGVNRTQVGWTYGKIDIQFPTVKTIHTLDQNRRPFNAPATEWSWLKSSSDAALNWLYSRAGVANIRYSDGSLKFDASDTGMLYFLLTDKQSNVTMTEVRNLFSN